MALRAAGGRASIAAQHLRCVHGSARLDALLRWTRHTIPPLALGTSGDEKDDDELQLWLPTAGSSSSVFEPSPATWSTLQAVTQLGRAGEWRGKRGIDWGTGGSARRPCPL
jgi:hypothetical protein